MSKHEARSRETKNKIYQAANYLLEKRGFNNITVQEICKEANVSIGSFYHHFQFKEALLTEIYRRDDGYFRKIVVNRIHENNAIDKLCTFLKLWLQFIMTSIGVTNIKHPDKQWDLFHQQMLSLDKITSQTLHDILVDGINSNEIIVDTSVDSVIDFIKSYMWGFSYRWCFQKGHIDSELNFEVLSSTIRTMLHPYINDTYLANTLM